MDMPFTPAQFFDVMRQYNEAVWPAQWALVTLAVAAILSAARASSRGSHLPGLALSALWLWMGAVYHLVFFRRVNPAAVLFGAAFLLQGAAFGWAAATGRLRFHAVRGARGIAGAGVLLYALVLYPALGAALGQSWPATPTFGLPCPTTILTLGLLLWAEPPAPRALLVIPGLWAVVATSAATRFGVWEDLGLTVTALVVVPLLMRGAGRRSAARPMRARAA